MKVIKCSQNLVICTLLLLIPNSSIADNDNKTRIDIVPKGSKAPARRLINVYVNDYTDELFLNYANGRAPFTYYIYDENMHPVMCGKGVFDERGLFVISMETFLSGEYSIEIDVNGNIYNNSFYKY